MGPEGQCALGRLVFSQKLLGIAQLARTQSQPKHSPWPLNSLGRREARGSTRGASADAASQLKRSKPIHSCIHSFFHSFVHSSIHSSIRSFIRSFVRSFLEKKNCYHWYYKPICFQSCRRFPISIHSLFKLLHQSNLLAINKIEDRAHWYLCSHSY